MKRTSRNQVPEMILGACCGIVATVPMTVAMLSIERLLPKRSREPQEPRQITDEVLDRTVGPADIAAPQRGVAAAFAHFGYGAAAGAAYPIVVRPFSRVPARGPAYGLVLYIVSYAGWLPACNILPAPHHRQRGRNVLLIASHLVWGAAVQASWQNGESATVRRLQRLLDHVP